MWEVAAYVIAALIVGISKTSVSGFGVLAVMLFALVMPAKESTAAVLLLLIVGDVVAVWRYREHGDWVLLRRLLPYVIPGIALGALFLRVVDDDVLRRSIGAILAFFVIMQIVLRLRTTRRVTPERAPRRHHLASAGYGTAAGFTTMTANAAGPVMTLYLLAAGVDKKAFVGTGAWYFLIVNVTKVPFSAALGLFPKSTLLLDLALVPVVLLGAFIGTRLTNVLSQRAFELLALGASVVSAVVLLVR
ncbi:MAG TPA: sulfite exporter TauE/SafE family protein [Actinomycetaceae bacterium]|nr:sulfite exporter TauE/SafE family protein [Actinomycetaceae bacterium]